MNPCPTMAVHQLAKRGEASVQTICCMLEYYSVSRRKLFRIHWTRIAILCSCFVQRSAPPRGGLAAVVAEARPDASSMVSQYLICENKTHDSVCDEWRASWFSRITFHWLTPLLALGYKRPLQHEDLGELAQQDTSASCVSRLQAGADGANSVWSLWNAFRQAFGNLMLPAGLCKGFGDLLGFVPPIMLNCKSSAEIFHIGSFLQGHW